MIVQENLEFAENTIHTQHHVSKYLCTPSCQIKNYMSCMCEIIMKYAIIYYFRTFLGHCNIFVS